jgi:hypothetical protein
MGGGVLLALGTASCLVEDTTVMEMSSSLRVFWWLGGQFSQRRTPDFGDVVARANNTPVPLRRHNRERNLASWQKISHRGQFRLRWCSTKLAREGGGGVSVHK